MFDEIDKLSDLNLNEFLDNLSNLDSKIYVLFLIEYIFANIINPNIIHYICLYESKFILTNSTTNNIFSTYLINSTISYEYKNIFNFYNLI